MTGNFSDARPANQIANMSFLDCMNFTLLLTHHGKLDVNLPVHCVFGQSINRNGSSSLQQLSSKHECYGGLTNITCAGQGNVWSQSCGNVVTASGA